MLNARLSSILSELMTAESPLTSTYLANGLNVTSRTIRSDVKELDYLLSKNGASITSIRGAGYRLSIHHNHLFRQFLQNTFQEELSNPVFPNERILYLLKRLLLTDGYLKLEDLADEMFISKSTVQNDMRDVRKRLKPYGIELEIKPNYGFKLRGDEVKLRYCMAEHIFPKRESEMDILNTRISILPKEELGMIRQTILERISEDEISLSDIGLNNLLIHIAIACKRIRNGKHVSFFSEDIKEIMNHKEYEVSRSIVRTLKEKLKVAFPEKETAYIAIHLMGAKRTAMAKIPSDKMEGFIDEETDRLTDLVMETIDEKFRLGIKNDKELKIGLCLHLKPALNRCRYGMNIRNPMLDAIKANYPLAFEAGIQAGEVIKKETGFDIQESEVGYLALHIGAALERRKMKTPSKRCIIVCASGAGSAMLLQDRLRSRFGSKLEIIGTVDYYKLNQMPLHALDFVISTIPLPDGLPIPVVKVNAILGGADLTKIEHVLTADTELAARYTRRQLVFLQEHFQSKEEVLRFLCHQVTALGLADEGLEASVLEREAVAPTCFGNLVAIPHPMTPQTDTTFWAVCTLQKPIEWEDKRVQFICLLCVEKDNTSNLQGMYKLLGNVLDNRSIVRELLKCKTYEEFMAVFRSPFSG
ncbi:BglG family transcription antiterminator [Bacillus sonorensis]|uniref:BigG family transcription antiterminator n=2 Tax=Bacillus sonorensis TaxID=119858 RepID=M5P2I5_9BACI|nr:MULTISPECIES: BglG family transcription antiterminator [Bacillus]TWK80887.1 putative licABCH operon regulator [Bacillus paralicheniformis]ASB86854.1 putative licABCH operon regulator [Bacillus sonorensis]EME73653.1 BigG family transcription antiterminator [Bacillus sonorensis L12]MBG9914616.1 PTS fructose transporter subunit IIA [Bacillus sonorensis]MCF7616107.1 BglG family transcription antiterminator [Bacillus sonorensis]